jgi:hypothetical protein
MFPPTIWLKFLRCELFFSSAEQNVLAKP